ncbi:AbfB domain-containing protein, partial [Actinoplanes philippinensis]|uniref:AbfB domain-containing protein n=1 Tax=Actinoplanes philippinensis TaxID=35752 RepID=UPI0033D7256B
VAGLAGTGVSFESVNLPGRYLRHSDYTIRLDANDNTATFRGDATFTQVAGLADASWSSFRSYNLPDRHLRHANYVLRIDPIGTGASERQDATFRVS